MKTFNRRRAQRSAKVRGSVVNTVQILEQRMMLSAFTPGDMVVYQDGNGTTALSGTTNPVFLDEYSPTGTLVQQIPMPTAINGSNQILTANSSASGGSGGLLTLSSDGSTLIVPGYDGSATNAETVGLVGVNGVPNTSNLYTSITTGTIRGAASPDGSTIVYLSGSSGTYSSTLTGATGQTITTINAGGNARGIQLANGNVYFTSGATWRIAIATGGTPPELPGITTTNVNGPYAFFFASDTSFDDTLYIAANGTNTVDKFSLISGTWTAEGSTLVPSIEGLTGVQTSPTNVTLYAAGNSFGTPATNGVFTLSDTLSPLGPTTMNSPTPTQIVTQTSVNDFLNGVALVPQAAAGPSINLQPTNTTATVGTSATFSAFATGVPAPAIQWMVNQNNGSGYQPISGANGPNLVLPSVTTAQSGYTYEAVFTNVSGVKTSSPATLTVNTGAQLFFDASTYTVNEGANNTATEMITVDRLGSTAAANSVTITTHDGTAMAGTNYTTAITGTNYSGGVLTFQPGDMSETFTVPILSPHPQGGNVSFTITLTNPTGGAALGAPTTTAVTITDNLETFSLAGASYNVDEPSAADVAASDTNAEISVVRTGLLDAATISFNTVASSAVDGTNYTGTGGAFTGSVTFAAGQQVADVSVPILSPASQGGNKTFTVNLSVTGPTTSLGSDFGQIGAVGSATETIIDTSALSNSLAGPAATTFNAEPTGNTPFNSNFTLIVGDTSTTNPTTTELSFYEYTLFEFTPTGSVGLYPATGFQVNSLSNLSFSMFTPNDGAYHPLKSGDFDVYYLSPADINSAANTIVVNPPSPTFNNAVSDGVDATQFQDAPVLLGTFGFQGGLSTGTFVTYTPATLSPAVTSAVLADLNGGLNFGLIATPQTQGIGSIATRNEGVFTTGGVNESPAISITANVVQTAQPETLALSSSAYSISETGGTESITLTRTGDTSDTATVTYSLTDGTALEGTNYGTAGTSSPPITGTATFLPTQATTSFNVPIINAANMQGDKALSITITNPTSNSSAHQTIAVLGQSSAILTIQDSNDTNPAVTLETLGPAAPATANDPPVIASEVADVEDTGVFEITEFKVAGTAASFASYGVADFNVPGSMNLDGNPDLYAPGKTITALNSLTLTVYNVGGGTSGPIDIYLVPQTTLSIALSSDPPAFDTGNTPEGLDASTFGTPVLLGKINWDATTASGTFVSLPLINYAQSTANTLIADLNGQTEFRIVATPENASAAANWGGEALSAGNPEYPVLTFGVQEGVVSSLPTWLAAGSNASWTAATHSLVVHGAADIIADPGSDEPIITTDGGAASVLKVDVASGGTLEAIHIGGITLTGGASMVVDSVGAGRTATNHDELLIASGGAFSIDSSSKLDLVDNDADFVGGNLSAITNSLKSGFNGSGSWWTGSGIMSSKAAASPAAKTLGVKMTGGDVLVKYTYVGDADLSGTLTAADYTAIDNGFNMSLSGYANGDFNYDGKINGDDYALIDNSYNTQGAISGASPLAAVAGSSEQIASVKPSPSVFATGVPISDSAPVPVLTGTAPAGTDSLFADDNKKTLAEDVLG